MFFPDFLPRLPVFQGFVFGNGWTSSGLIILPISLKKGLPVAEVFDHLSTPCCNRLSMVRWQSDQEAAIYLMCMYGGKVIMTTPAFGIFDKTN